MVLYPTEEWLEEYRDRFNERFDGDRGDGTPADEFTGDLLYVITDVPLSETKISDLPREVFVGLPRNVRRPLAVVSLDDRVASLTAPLSDAVRYLGAPLSIAGATMFIRGGMRQALPERTADLLRQVDDHVIDGTLYTFVRIENGECTEVELLDGPNERATDFVLRGHSDAWGRIVDGSLDTPSAIGVGDLVLDDGNAIELTDHPDTMLRLGEAAADVETTRLF